MKARVLLIRLFVIGLIFINNASCIANPSLQQEIPSSANANAISLTTEAIHSTASTSEHNSNIPLPNDLLEQEIYRIDQRVLEIDRCYSEYVYIGDSVFRERYDKDGVLVYREAGEIYEPIEGLMICEMYYDENKKLVFAEVSQYRNVTFWLYFLNDEPLMAKMGSLRGDNEERRIDEDGYEDYMLYAVNICLKSAYTN